MNDWQKLVTKLSKENPGKALGAILPLASKIYRKAKASGLPAVKTMDAKTKDAKTKDAKTMKGVKKARKTAKRRKN
jgi:hypothetical protein